MARNPKNRPSFFKILVGDLFFTSLRVPPDFLNNYLKRIKFPTESTIALKSDPEVSWKVKIEIKREGGVYFTEGWKKISKDMQLAIGDFLVFYLVGDAAFEIRAYDRTCCERISGWCPSSRSETGSGDGDDGDDDDDDLQQAGSEFASKYPFFQVNITKDCLSHGRLNVPWTFAKGNMNNTGCRHQIVTLETGGGGSGRSWLVKLIIDICPRRRARFFGGLIAFLKENYVKEGDLCTFELLNRKNLVFRVSISRG